MSSLRVELDTFLYFWYETERQFNGLDWSLLVKRLEIEDTHNSWSSVVCTADDAKAKHVSQVQKDQWNNLKILKIDIFSETFCANTRTVWKLHFDIIASQVKYLTTNYFNNVRVVNGIVNKIFSAKQGVVV